ncbi:hypothetical protein F511_24397 [Dorcoceras hygrometricum]|uniref:Uncharacterized protein n=1 Tax=Dorcoceras hygrometricum TaxID=472368 RepID=A0A2Z7AXB3_9LAMI|nr:hypothetical protein F511_24397 [Dorcoceras hygrometricum]
MSLFHLQDVCIAIGSLATLDLPMVADLIGIYVLKGPYCTLTTTNWFLQALSVIPRGSWRDVASSKTLAASPTPPLYLSAAPLATRRRRRPHAATPRRTCSGHSEEEFPSVLKSINFLVQDDWRKIVSSRGPDSRSTAAYSLKCQFPHETGRSQAPRRQQDPIQQPAAARTPRLYTSPRLCQSLVLRLCEKCYKHRV